MNKVDLLVISAHPDDAEISAAGTIIKSVKEGKIVGDHVAGMGAISDLAALYQIQLDVIEREGSPPWVFPRASLGPNTL